MPDCRECRADIVFARSPKSGKMIPLDARPLHMPDIPEKQRPHAYVVREVAGERQAEKATYDDIAHVSHFLTCTNPKRFSKKAKKR